MRGAAGDPAMVVMVVGVAVLAVVGFAARRLPANLVVVALLSLALSVRYVDTPDGVDPDTFSSVRTALDTVQKIGLTAVALLYARHNGVDSRRLLPAAALAVIGVLSFGPAAFHSELTPLQVLRSFLGLSTTWLFLAVRRTPEEARRQLWVVVLLPLLNLAAGLVLWPLDLNEFVRHEYTGAWRLQGASIPAHLGLLCVVAVAAGMYVTSRASRVMGLLVAVNLAIAILTGTRTAIAMCLVLVTVGLNGRRKFLRLHPRRVVATATAYGVALGAVAYAYLPALRDRFFGNPLERGFNTSGREGAWAFYWATAQVDPVFGRGLGAATVANTGQIPPEFTVPHNEYLRLLVEGGWVGLSLFLLTAGIAFAPLFRRTGASGVTPAVVVVVWTVYCLMDNALSTPQGSVTFATVIAAMGACAVSREGGTAAGAPVRTGAPGSTVPTVVYIAGVSRSGSTLLERALDRLPDVVCAGELAHLWRRGAMANQLCSCGRAFHSCPFWARVGRCLPGGWSPEHAQEVVRLQERAGRHRIAPLVLSGLLAGRRRRDVEEYGREMAALYVAIADSCGARIVVDSSKLPILAHLLARSGRVDLRVLHLVRDSRAYAFAARKMVARPEAPGEFMPRPGPVRCCAEWLGFHLLTARLRACSSRYVRLSYEDFARDPRRSLEGVLWMFDRIGDAGMVEGGDDDPVIDLRPWHGVAGNPLRFAVGRTRIRLDDAWRRGLPCRERRLVTVLTAPGLLRFGYLMDVPRAARRLRSQQPSAATPAEESPPA